MTPEQLEEIPGIGPKTVESIQLAVNGYYAQYEDQTAEAEAAGEPEAGDEHAGEAAAVAEAVGELPAGDPTEGVGLEPVEEALDAAAESAPEEREAAPEAASPAGTEPE